MTDLTRTILDIVRAAKPRRRRLPPGECQFCDREREMYFSPCHDASAACESGKHPHCTCNFCW